MHITNFLRDLEIILREKISDHYPVDWDEDTITRNTLKELRISFKAISISGLKSRMRIQWSAFKLTGKSETKFGDVALLVNITYQNGDRIEGVAFLEAKKRKINTTKFGAIKIRQLSKIFRNTPFSMVLLYDYEDVTEFANIYSKPFIFDNWFKCKPCTRSVVVPTNIVLETQQKDTRLYKYSLPFSHQLFFRHLHGFDLDFRNKITNIAKGYNPSKGIPTYLIVACVAFGKTEPSQSIDFRRDYFTPI